LTRCQTFDNWQAFAIHILTLTFRAHFEIRGIIVQGGPGMPKWEGGTGPLPILLCVVVAGNASKVHNNIAITWNLDKFHYTYANQNINHFFPPKKGIKG
jgi:hypothetical protein